MVFINFICDILNTSQVKSSQIYSYYDGGNGDGVGSGGEIFLTRQRQSRNGWDGKGKGRDGLTRGCSQRSKPEKPWDNEIMGSVSLPAVPRKEQHSMNASKARERAEPAFSRISGDRLKARAVRQSPNLNCKELVLSLKYRQFWGFYLWCSHKVYKLF